MELSLQNVFSLALYIECLAGVTVNLIIVAANIMKWKILKSLPICDRILSCVAISRSFSIFNIFLFNLLYKFYPWVFLNFVVTVTVLSYGIILHYSNLWFAAVLCVFYCVKVTSYNWKFFIFLKTKISSLVPWFLLASFIISVSSALPFSLCFHDLNPQNVSYSQQELITVSKERNGQSFYNLYLIFLLGSCPPFIIFLVADGLLLHSLWMHTRRMRGSGSGFRSPNLESHFNVVKNMSLFLVLQMLHFVFLNLLYSGCLHRYPFLNSANLIIICSFPFLHSLYMICSCSEIKKAVISLFRGLIRCQQSSL